MSLFTVHTYNGVSGNLHSVKDVEAPDEKTAVALATDHLSLEYAKTPQFNPNQYNFVAAPAAPSGTITAELIADLKNRLADAGGVLARNYEAEIAELKNQMAALFSYFQPGVATPQPVATPSSAPADLPHAPQPVVTIPTPAVLGAAGAPPVVTGIVPPNAAPVGASAVQLIQNAAAGAQSIVGRSVAEIEAEMGRLAAERDAARQAGA